MRSLDLLRRFLGLDRPTRPRGEAAQLAAAAVAISQEQRTGAGRSVVPLGRSSDSELVVGAPGARVATVAPSRAASMAAHPAGTRRPAVRPNGSRGRSRSSSSSSAGYGYGAGSGYGYDGGSYGGGCDTGSSSGGSSFGGGDSGGGSSSGGDAGGSCM